MTVKTALVTGSAGFVGRHFTRRLERDGYEVDTCDPRGSDGHDALELFASETKRYDLVIHAAASSPHRRAIDTEPHHFPYNVQLDAAALSWAVRTRPGHFVYLSSSAVYPWVAQTLQSSKNKTTRLAEELVGEGQLAEPHDDYGTTKLIGERMANALRKTGVPVTVVRPFSGYGDDQSEEFPFAAIVERVRRGENPIEVWGSGNQVRDWIHIDDIVNAIMILIQRKDTSQPVNLCTGIGTSIFALSRMAVQIGGVGQPTKSTSDENPNTGVEYRVGDPHELHRFYHPRINLAQGIARRLEVH
jgi:nucleoside-diphosphate-sugar epimerase